MEFTAESNPNQQTVNSVNKDSSTENESMANSNEQHAQDGNTTCYEIQTNLRMRKNDDGTISYSHDRIEVDGIQMVLVPASALELDPEPIEVENGKFE